MYNLCRILQHIVDGFDDVSLVQHHPVIERYQLVFHVHTQSGHQLYAILKEKVKQLLRYVTFVCEQLAIQSFGESREYLIGVSPEIMAHWNHRRINKGYAGTHSERTRIKKEHELEEHSAFQLHKAVVRHGFRKIRFHCALDKEQIVVFEIAECTEMEIQQDRHYFTV